MTVVPKDLGKSKAAQAAAANVVTCQLVQTCCRVAEVTMRSIKKSCDSMPQWCTKRHSFSDMAAFQHFAEITIEKNLLYWPNQF